MNKKQSKNATPIDNLRRRQFLQKASVGMLAAAPVAGALAAPRTDSVPSDTALAPEAWMAA